MANPSEHAKPTHGADQPEAKTEHGGHSNHSKQEHTPKGHQRWYQKLFEKFSLKSEDFKPRPLLERAKWALAGGTAVAWLHSSILFPALGIVTTAAFLTNKFILKPEEHHGGGNGGH
jgi:hypothetical protein